MVGVEFLTFDFQSLTSMHVRSKKSIFASEILHSQARKFQLNDVILRLIKQLVKTENSVAHAR